MYCRSSEFLQRIQRYIDEVEKKSNGLFSFVEYIPLPFFGNTILRFDINRESYTLDDLDSYEMFIQNIVQDEFLVDFMGSVYQQVGLESWGYDEKFKKCYHKYMAVPVIVGNHQAELVNDGISLLRKCGLPTDARVWEIQIEEDISLFLLGEKNQQVGSWVLEENTVHVYEVDELSCVGLMRAITYAHAQQRSLIRVLLEL